jgi:branched-subunit amino acid transport protein
MNGPNLNGTDLWTLGVIVGLSLVTVVTRCFFFMSSEPWHLPHWAQRGLQYAPIAALAAVVAPEVFMTQGQLIANWQDARIYAALAGAAYFFWRKGQGQAVLGTIVSGMAVYLPLHLGFGW